MSHNGGILQFNLGPAHVSSPFINLVKDGSAWAYISGSAQPPPSELNENGYPISISNGGVYTVMYNLPPQADLPGNYKCRWIGEGTISTFVMEGGDVIDGSKSGVNGWFTCRPTGTHGFIGISSINPANPITHLEFYYEEYEALLDTGEVFMPRFKEVMEKGGVLRFLNPMRGNSPTYTDWSHRKSVDYFSWEAEDTRPSLYRGVAVKTGNNYALDLGDGGSPQERDTHIIRFDSAGDAGSTLNGRPLLSLTGSYMEYEEWQPAANKSFIVVYDKAAGGWLLSSYLLRNGWPPEIMLQLCKEVGAHFWATLPYLALDADTASGTTDFTTDFAGFVRQWCIENNCEWMLHFFEPPNELWNGANGFYQTPYATIAAARRWGAQSNVTISVATPGVVTWTGHGLSANDPVLLSSTGALPTGLYQWANYFVKTVLDANTFTVSLTQGGTAIATTGAGSGTHRAYKNIYGLHDWYGRAGSLMAEQIDAVYEGDTSKYRVMCGVQTFGSPASSGGRLSGRHVSVDGGTPYRDWIPIVCPANYYNSALWGTAEEGEMAAAYALADTEGKAAIVAEYTAGVLGPGGGQSIPSVRAQLEDWKDWADGLRLMLYEGHYSPDYGGGEEITALRAASKSDPALRDYERLMYSICLQLGYQYPSVYRPYGSNDAWAVFDPNLYVDTPPAWLAIEDIAFSPNPVRFTLRSAVA